MLTAFLLIRRAGIVFVCLCALTPMQAQTATGTPTADIQGVIARLDRLEKQNQELLTEIHELRDLLAQSPPAPTAATPPANTEASPPEATPTPAERLDVQESRTQELSQTKVGTFQRMPVWLTGMVLFNAFHNGGYGGGAEVPLVAQLNKSPDASGATFRQTVIGLKFDGPNLPGGGKASGTAYFDFWGGTAAPANNLFRIRTAMLDLTWKNTTISAGQDKPIVSPREPTSLAQVGLAPLSGAGDLWDWQPQLHIEQRFAFSDQAGIRAQAGVYETSEIYPGAAPPEYSGTLERQRPAYEGRLLFYRGSEKRRFEIAPGYHFSVTHVAGQSVTSQLGTLDWLLKPSNSIEFSGALFHGTDDSGLGGLRQGFTVLPSESVIPVHATGAWGQISLFPAARVSVHLYSGVEADRASDLTGNSVRRNLVYAGNVVYKLAPNVLAAFEASQTRTDYISAALRLNNHYDLALAYLF
jgi:hypothetical protein